MPVIFVTVGTQKFPFDRLLQQVDALAATRGGGARFFAQTGSSAYTPKHYPCQQFLTKEKFNRQIDRCDLVVAHGGVGTITTALKRGKPVVVVPRLKKYGEHVDDHQLDIARAFGQKKLAGVCGEQDDLGAVIEESLSATFEPYVSQQQHLLQTIRTFLEGVGPIA